MNKAGATEPVCVDVQESVPQDSRPDPGELFGRYNSRLSAESGDARAGHLQIGVERCFWIARKSDVGIVIDRF